MKAPLTVNLPPAVTLTELHTEARRIRSERARFVAAGFRDLATGFGDSAMTLFRIAEKTGSMMGAPVIFDTDERLFP